MSSASSRQGRKKTGVGTGFHATRGDVIKEESDGGTGHDRTELTRMEVELCKQNFGFYDRNRQGYVERFELPMLLIACGYNLPKERIEELNTFLDTRKATRIDLSGMLHTLTHLKELELMNEREGDADEYRKPSRV